MRQGRGVGHSVVALVVLVLFVGAFIARRSATDARGAASSSAIAANSRWGDDDEASSSSSSSSSTAASKSWSHTKKSHHSHSSSSSDDDDDGGGADDVADSSGDDALSANESQPLDAFAPFEKLIDLRNFTVVQQFLESKGIGADSGDDEILQWVPSALVVRMWPSRVQRELGADAESGHVAFSILQPSKDSRANSYTAATYMIVMTLRGEVESLQILTNGSNWGGDTASDKSVLFFC